jgi:hypothetical protein
VGFLAPGNYLLFAQYTGWENQTANYSVIITGTAGEALSQYDAVYQDTADSGEWKKGDADAAASALVMGVVTESGGIADTETGEITLLGEITNGSWSWTAGAKLYPSATAGAFAESAGANGGVVATALTATKIFFNP